MEYNNNTRRDDWQQLTEKDRYKNKVYFEEDLKPFQIICTKTLYNYIDKGLFLNTSNKDLLIKKLGRKKAYKKVRAVALNNK